MNQRDPNRSSRNEFRRSLQGLFALGSKEDFSNMVAPHKESGLSEGPCPENANRPHARTRNWYEDRAVDLHGFCRMVIGNVKTPKQMSEAVRATGPRGRGFNKDLADLLEILATSLSKTPLIAMFDRLNNIGLETLIPTDKEPLTLRHEAASRTLLVRKIHEPHQAYSPVF